MTSTLTKASSNVGDQVITRVENLTKVGFSCPKNYNFINAIKSSMLVLQDLKDKNGKPALEVCTQNSIASALFEMAVKGLSAANKTCYFVVRGDKLCMTESYYGKALQVKRIYPNFDPHPVVIHEGDEFVFEIDPKTGCKRIVKHTQSLANLDKDFVGAYMYIPTADGGQDLYIMSKKQILTAWSQSSSKEQTVHKKFSEKMIGKTIVNSGCNMVINSNPELAYAASNSDVSGEEDNSDKTVDVEYEEIQESNEIVDTETGEIVSQKDDTQIRKDAKANVQQNQEETDF